MRCILHYTLYIVHHRCTTSICCILSCFAVVFLLQLIILLFRLIFLFIFPLNFFFFSFSFSAKYSFWYIARALRQLEYKIRKINNNGNYNNKNQIVQATKSYRNHFYRKMENYILEGSQCQPT